MQSVICSMQSAVLQMSDTALMVGERVNFR